MNADRLIEYYERVVDAPDAVERLRRFILDLAVRGRLVRQDPSEESASSLVRRIAAEKSQAANVSSPRRPRLLNANSDPSTAFELPESWQWIPATFPASMVSDHGKKVQTKDVLDSGLFPVVDQGKVFVRGYCNDAEKVIHVDTPIILFGDHTREVKLINFDFVVGADGVKLLKPIALFPQYYYMVLMWLPLDSRGYGRHFKLLRASWLPLPPLAEQHRIVAKVDELTRLCDEIKAKRSDREAMRNRFTSVTLAHLSGLDPNHDVVVKHARFAIQSLDILTARSDQIRKLRETILNLAVRGKLEHATSDPQRDIELNSLATIVRGSSPRPKGDPGFYGGTVPRLLIADITRDGKYVTPRIDSLTERGAELSRPMKAGSLVLAISGSYGVPAFLAVDACIHDGFIGFRSISPELDPEYLYLVLLFRRPYFDEVVKDSGLKNLTTEHLKRLMVPLHPLNKQRRIVKDVARLMALCDQLENALSTRYEKQRRLFDALTAEALTSAEQDITELIEA